MRVVRIVAKHRRFLLRGPNIFEQLRRHLQAGRLYVKDRGYADYQLFQDVLDARSSFIGRIRENAVWQVVEERPVSAKARAFALYKTTQSS